MSGHDTPGAILAFTALMLDSTICASSHSNIYM